MYLARTGKFKRQKIPNTGEDVGAPGISRTAREGGNVTTALESLWACLLEVNVQIASEPRTHSPEMHISTHKNYLKTAYGGVICKRQDMEGTQVSVNHRMQRPQYDRHCQVSHGKENGQATVTHTVRRTDVRKTTYCVLPSQTRETGPWGQTAGWQPSGESHPGATAGDTCHHGHVLCLHWVRVTRVCALFL